MSMFVVYLMC